MNTFYLNKRNTCKEMLTTYQQLGRSEKSELVKNQGNVAIASSTRISSDSLASNGSKIMLKQRIKQQSDSQALDIE